MKGAVLAPWRLEEPCLHRTPTPRVAVPSRGTAGPGDMCCVCVCPASHRPARGQPGSPAIIIMAPTRELAMQIQEQAAVFGRAASLRSVAIYGGAPKGERRGDICTHPVQEAWPGQLRLAAWAVN